MARTVRCVKMEQDLEGLDKPPIPGDLGTRIYESVSKQAWAAFLEHFKMVMNEYRINLMDPKSDEIFKMQIIEYFFREN